MSVEARAAELFIDFPVPPTTAVGTVHARQSGKLLIVSGALPFSDGRLQGKGRLGLELNVDQGRSSARLAVIQSLAMARAQVGTLDKIRQVVQLTGYVACGAEFQEQSKVLDAASQLLSDLFGPAGLHARTVVGVNALPSGACVMIELMFELK